jgi:uncharacterized protein YegJ (DUF2314 family)
MSNESPSKVFMFDGEDADMLKAFQRARAHFRFFWREIIWERHRIVPAFEMACIKAGFSDESPDEAETGKPKVEHMWMSEVDFDGRRVYGKPLNQPNWLKSVREGDDIGLPAQQMCDWMYSIGGKVYGGFTVNMMRSKMSTGERREHDKAWGLCFGDPNKIAIVQDPKPVSKLKALFSTPKEQDLNAEHPMAVNMLDGFRTEIKKHASTINSKGHRGWTKLHQYGSAGALQYVQILLEHGADASITSDAGLTAAQVAKVLGWPHIVALLSKG